MEVIEKNIKNEEETTSEFSLDLLDDKANISINIEGEITRKFDDCPGDYTTAPCSSVESTLEVWDFTVYDSEGDTMKNHNLKLEYVVGLAEKYCIDLN